MQKNSGKKKEKCKNCGGKGLIRNGDQKMKCRRCGGPGFKSWPRSRRPASPLALTGLAHFSTAGGLAVGSAVSARRSADGVERLAVPIVERFAHGGI